MRFARHLRRSARLAGDFNARRRRLIMAGIGVPAQAALVPWAMLGCSEDSGTTIAKSTPPPAAVYSGPAGAPDVTGKVPSLGWALRTNRMNWMGDFLDLAKIPPPVPFFCYHDAAKGIVAPVQNGKPARRYVDPRHGDILFADLAAGQHIISCRIVSNSPKYLGEASVLVF